MYYITEKEVDEYFDMKTAIEAMRDAFGEYYAGNAGADARQRTFSGGSVLSTMPAFMNKYHISGFKTYIATGKGARFVVLLFDTKTTDLIAIVEANRMGQIRTGALTALGASLLHRDTSVFTLIGSGFQAETQLEGILTTSAPDEIRVYSRSPQRGSEFAKRMTEKFGKGIRQYDNLRTALEGADLISCITSSRDPIISDLSFLKSYHLNIAGANVLGHREVSEGVINDADLVVVEHLEQAFRESSEISDYVKSGGKAVEFKEIVGKEANYKNFKRTVFKTMGIGLEDIVSARYLLKKMDLI